MASIWLYSESSLTPYIGALYRVRRSGLYPLGSALHIRNRGRLGLSPFLTEARTVWKIRHLNHWRCLRNSSESCDFYKQVVRVTYWCGNSEWSLNPGAYDSQVLLSGCKKKVSHFFFSHAVLKMARMERGSRDTAWSGDHRGTRTWRLPRCLVSPTHLFFDKFRLLFNWLVAGQWKRDYQSQSRRIWTGCMSCPPSSVDTV